MQAIIQLTHISLYTFVLSQLFSSFKIIYLKLAFPCPFGGKKIYKLQLVLSEMLLILQTSCLKETTLMELIRSFVSKLIAPIDLLF